MAGSISKEHHHHHLVNLKKERVPDKERSERVVCETKPSTIQVIIATRVTDVGQPPNPLVLGCQCHLWRLFLKPMMSDNYINQLSRLIIINLYNNANKGNEYNNK
jgi:hypothetical protein